MTETLNKYATIGRLEDRLAHEFQCFVIVDNDIFWKMANGESFVDIRINQLQRVLERKQLEEKLRKKG